MDRHEGRAGDAPGDAAQRGVVVAPTGVSSVSEVLERGLAALIEHELERIHVEGYARQPRAGETVDVVDAGIWADLPWDDEGE